MLAHQLLVAAFDHDPDHRLGARRRAARRAPRRPAGLRRAPRPPGSAATAIGIEPLAPPARSPAPADTSASAPPARPALRPVCFMIASTCSALTSPSPVVVWSRHRMWPEVSPPSMPPRLLQHARARSGRRPWRAGNRCPASLQRDARARGCSSRCRRPGRAACRRCLRARAMMYSSWSPSTMRPR